MESTTLYVDIENLQDIAKHAITSTIVQWPEDFPKIDTLQLYVTADQAQLWSIWASNAFPTVRLSVQGVQRYGSASKNLADMSLILDALADLLKKRTTHVAVLSDDSDYVILFAAISREVSKDAKNRVPFAWFLTDRPGTHSTTLIDFLPADYVHTVSCADRMKTNGGRARKVSNNAISLSPEDELISKKIIEQTPVGTFKNADCMRIVKKNFPEDKLANEESAKFGLHFAKRIAPILERYGVRSLKGRNTRKYEMTEEAKQKAL